MGQRRIPGGTFPPGGGGGIPGDDGGVHQDEVDPDGSGGDGPQINPCLDPATALPWNADAEGAAAVAAFLQAASNLGFADAPNGTPSLGNREFGRGLARGPNNTVWGNAVSWGVPPVPPSTTSSMTVDFTGISFYDYLGDVHSHPNGNPLPGQEDWDGFMSNNEAARAQAGRTSETFYLYIVTVDQNGNPSGIYVYQDGPRAAGSADPARPTAVGPELNPDAQPCP